MIAKVPVRTKAVNRLGLPEFTFITFAPLPVPPSRQGLVDGSRPAVRPDRPQGNVRVVAHDPHDAHAPAPPAIGLWSHAPRRGVTKREGHEGIRVLRVLRRSSL